MRNNMMHRRGWFVVALLGMWLWGAGPAVAGYDARGSELQPRVDELVRSLEDAEKITEKFHHDFDRHSLGDDLK